MKTSTAGKTLNKYNFHLILMSKTSLTIDITIHTLATLKLIMSFRRHLAPQNYIYNNIVYAITQKDLLPYWRLMNISMSQELNEYDTFEVTDQFPDISVYQFKTNQLLFVKRKSYPPFFAYKYGCQVTVHSISNFVEIFHDNFIIKRYLKFN